MFSLDSCLTKTSFWIIEIKEKVNSGKTAFSLPKIQNLYVPWPISLYLWLLLMRPLQNEPALDTESHRPRRLWLIYGLLLKAMQQSSDCSNFLFFCVNVHLRPLCNLYVNQECSPCLPRMWARTLVRAGRLSSRIPPLPCKLTWNPTRVQRRILDIEYSLSFSVPLKKSEEKKQLGQQLVHVVSRHDLGFLTHLD